MKKVTYVEDGKHPAIMLGPDDAAKADLFVGRPNGSVTFEQDVPRRAESDYGPEGGNKTFH